MLWVFVLAFFLPLIWADCPPGTIYGSSFNKCYKFFNQPTGFLAAEQSCQGLGGHLVALKNGFEASFVSGVVLQQSPSVKSFWIGANYLITSSWLWTYNVSFSYSNWAPGQPADPSINQCGAVRDSDNYWTKEICNSQKPFVCSIDPNAVPVGSPTCPPPPTYPVSMTSTAVPPTCPPEPTKNLTCAGKCFFNYTQYPIDCQCYYLYQKPAFSLYDAVSYCGWMSGSLVKITSADQNSWLTNFLYKQPPSPYLMPGQNSAWIGLSCPGPTKDDCHWVDGSPLTGYDNIRLLNPTQVWDGTNPNFFLNIAYYGGGGDWLRCSNADGTICTLFPLCTRDSCPPFCPPTG